MTSKGRVTGRFNLLCNFTISYFFSGRTFVPSGRPQVVPLSRVHFNSEQAGGNATVFAEEAILRHMQAGSDRNFAMIQNHVTKMLVQLGERLAKVASP